MTDRWRPLRTRRGSEHERSTYDALHEGVPDWLQASLHVWITQRFRDAGYNNEPLLRKLERKLRTRLNWRDQGPLSDLIIRMTSDHDFALEVTDFVLNEFMYDFDGGAELEWMLSEAGSAWSVGQDGEDKLCLERRVDDTVKAAADAVMEQSGRASEHVRRAWHSAYGREPDPSDTYAEAVKAVEVAGAPIITPKDPVPSPGKMAKALEDAPQKWEVGLAAGEMDGVQVVASLMRLLVKGQHDRHGRADEDSPLDVSQPEAEAAVQLAVLLVSWFTTGVVRRADA